MKIRYLYAQKLGARIQNERKKFTYHVKVQKNI